MGKGYDSCKGFMKNKSEDCTSIIAKSMNKNMHKVIAEDIKKIKKGEIDNLLKIKVSNREVSVLPYFINYCIFRQDSLSMKAFVSKYLCENLEDYISLGREGVENILDKKDINILKCLIGSDCEFINKYACLFSYRDKETFYSNMINILKIDAVGFYKNGASLISLSNEVENSMAISFMICLKWFNEKRVIPSSVFSIDNSVTELLNKLLSNKLSWYEYFNKSIDEEELCSKLFDVPRNLPSPISKFDFDKHSELIKVGQGVREVLELRGVKPLKFVYKDRDVLNKLLSQVNLSKDLYSEQVGMSDIMYKKALISDIDIIKYINNKESTYKKTEDKLKETSEELKESLVEREELHREVKKLTKEIDKQNKEIDSLSDRLSKYECKEIPELDEAREKMERLSKEIDKLRDSLKNQQEENKSLSRDIESLSIKNRELKDTNKELQRNINELQKTDEEIVEEVAEEVAVSLEEMVDKLKDKRLVVVGGRTCIEDNLKEIGFNSIKHLDIQNHMYINSNIDLGDYDCMVIITTCVKHAATSKAIKHAKNIGAKIVRVSSSNVDRICEDIYNVIIAGKEEEEYDIYD